MRSWEECGRGLANAYWKSQSAIRLGRLTKCGWIFHGGSTKDTSDIAAPALMSDFKSVTKSWKGTITFRVCQRFLLTLKDSIFPDLVLKTAEVFLLSSSNRNLPLSAPLPQRQPLQHMEQNLAWGRHSTWKISTQTVKVWPSYKQLEAAPCIGRVQQWPNRRCYKLHQYCVYIYVHGNTLPNYNINQ